MPRIRHRNTALGHFGWSAALPIALGLLVTAATGCGDPAPDDGVSGAAATDADTPDTTTDAANTPDTADNTDTADNFDAASQDSGGSGDTGPVADTKPADCPGGPACACAANDECDSSICVPLAQGGECAEKCVDTCKAGFKCAPVSAGGGDTVTICVPTLEWLCDPCTKSDDCGGLGLQDAACVDYGSAGGFCGVPCADDAGCPTDYVCKQGTSIEAKPVKQCVRKNAEDAGFGTCLCSESAKAKQLQTSCFIEHKNDAGELVGKCAGDRSCGDSGLSSCQAPSLAAESCNGIDDDCDGETDEASCDDNNACTLDACDTSAAGAKPACAYKKLDEQPCDADGSACTEKDACDGGICVPGKPIDCNDGNGCTTDACDPAAGCTQTNDDGKACEADGNPCTDGDLCTKGSCTAGPVKTCASGDPCVLGKCTPATGLCAFKNLTAPCDDGNPCTAKDGCDGGFCTGAPLECDDQNPCTADTCAAPTGCVHKPTAAVCDDGSACTWSDSCAAGKCVGLAITATDCDDSNACTVDTCDATAKGPGKLAGCVHNAQSNTPCDDGNKCTLADRCLAGKCQPGQNAGCQCITDKDCASKEDGNLCNGVLLCDHSGALPVCKVDPKSIVTCKHDGNVCTTTGCVPQTGACAVTAQQDGKLCDADASVCSQNDACKTGKCTAGPALPCDDSNACTTDACDPKQGCVHSDAAGTCSDDDACTAGDKCGDDQAGKWGCQPGSTVQCDDNNPCTIESCVKAKGCVKVVDTTHKEACYSGAKGTEKVGTCVGGFRTCGKDGSFGACVGEVTPNQTEKCDGKDDDCDGKTDIGCAAAGFAFKVVEVAVDGSNIRVKSAAVAGSSGGEKTDAALGWLAFLQRWIK